jgi:hypothetical protein
LGSVSIFAGSLIGEKTVYLAYKYSLPVVVLVIAADPDIADALSFRHAPLHSVKIDSKTLDEVCQ